MSVTVSVGLLSGRTVTLQAEPDVSVRSLKKRAQSALEVGGGRLLEPSGNVLDDAATIKKARLQHGDVLTLHISRVQIAVSGYDDVNVGTERFTAILGDRSVVTWGHSGFGGDSIAVQPQLQNVQQIQSNGGSFAAILAGGSVITWGDSKFGGDSISVQHQLKNVKQIQASFSAFAAIRADGSVITWGHSEDGGDSSAVQDQLKNVQQIQCNGAAFAAIRADGLVITWAMPTMVAIAVPYRTS